LNENAEHIISTDSKGNDLTGDRYYKLYLPPHIPASEFWSVIVYDNQTHLIICSNQSWPSVYKNRKNLVINPDGSVEIWFGPKPAAGFKENWIQTMAGKGWYAILRLYSPQEAWVNGTWRPGGMEEIKSL
jgi:hypothetical protein